MIFCKCWSHRYNKYTVTVNFRSTLRLCLHYSWFPTRWRHGGHVQVQNDGILSRVIYMKIEFSSQRRKCFCSWPTTWPPWRHLQTTNTEKLSGMILYNFPPKGWWITKDIPSYGSQSKRAKIAILIWWILKTSILYVTLHCSDWRGETSLRYRNRAEITVLMCWTEALSSMVFVPA